MARGELVSSAVNTAIPSADLSMQRNYPGLLTKLKQHPGRVGTAALTLISGGFGPLVASASADSSTESAKLVAIGQYNSLTNDVDPYTSVQSCYNNSVAKIVMSGMPAGAEIDLKIRRDGYSKGCDGSAYTTPANSAQPVTTYGSTSILHADSSGNATLISGFSLETASLEWCFQPQPESLSSVQDSQCVQINLPQSPDSLVTPSATTSPVLTPLPGITQSPDSQSLPQVTSTDIPSTTSTVDTSANQTPVSIATATIQPTKTVQPTATNTPIPSPSFVIGPDNTKLVGLSAEPGPNGQPSEQAMVIKSLQTILADWSGKPVIPQSDLDFFKSKFPSLDLSQINGQVPTIESALNGMTITRQPKIAGDNCQEICINGSGIHVGELALSASATHNPPDIMQDVLTNGVFKEAVGKAISAANSNLPGTFGDKLPACPVPAFDDVALTSSAKSGIKSAMQQACKEATI